MKLSIAMMLGSTTCKMRAGDINHCAIGAALDAVGVQKNKDKNDFARLNASEKIWPWLFSFGHRYLQEIVVRFDSMVVHGKMTYEQLIDYVASVEPACEICNKFECSCVGLRIQEVPAAIQKPLVLVDPWAHENVE